MRILVELGHPAHFHLFKNVIKNLENNGNQVYVLIKTKDILANLLEESNIAYRNILQNQSKNRTKLITINKKQKRDWKVFWFTLFHRIDILIGSTPHVAHVGWLLKRHSIIFGEDDDAIVPQFGKITHPFAKEYLSPMVCNNGKFDKKSIKYNGFQKLAYLHPNQFTPQESIVTNYFKSDRPYFLIRFAKLSAYYDINAKGITTSIAEQIIVILSPHGDIYITSERELEPQFEKYRLKINPLDIHHVMAFATLYIGDSQSMAVEAAMLGVPSIRFNDFAGKISVLEELEHKYELTFGIKTSETEKLYDTIKSLLNTPNLRQTFQSRRQKMLDDKIDVTAFFTWFIENYPESAKIIKQNPDYQYNFK